MDSIRTSKPIQAKGLKLEVGLRGRIFVTDLFSMAYRIMVVPEVLSSSAT